MSPLSAATCQQVRCVVLTWITLADNIQSISSDLKRKRDIIDQCIDILLGPKEVGILVVDVSMVT